jgi:hypothetical protein
MDGKSLVLLKKDVRGRHTGQVYLSKVRFLKSRSDYKEIAQPQRKLRAGSFTKRSSAWGPRVVGSFMDSA